jgi:hypothetical protein
MNSIQEQEQGNKLFSIIKRGIYEPKIILSCKQKTTFFTTILLIIISACSSQVWAQPGTDDPDHACLDSTEDYWVINTPGSTYDWVLSGGGTIMNGQGTSAISINWTSEGPSC